MVAEEELAKRKANPPEKKYPKGLLSRYCKLVGSAAEGTLVEY